MNSGAGALISRGMMEKLPLSFMHKCIFDIKRAAGGLLSLVRKCMHFTLQDQDVVMCHLHSELPSLRQCSLAACAAVFGWLPQPVSFVGADDLFSRCVQQAGYAFTSPGYSFYHWEAKGFDPGPQSGPLLEQTFQAASSGAAQGVPLVSSGPHHCTIQAPCLQGPTQSDLPDYNSSGGLQASDTSSPSVKLAT